MSKGKKDPLTIKTPRDRSVSPAPFIVAHDTFIKNTEVAGGVKNVHEDTMKSKKGPIENDDRIIVRALKDSKNQASVVGTNTQTLEDVKCVKEEEKRTNEDMNVQNIYHNNKLKSKDSETNNQSNLKDDLQYQLSDLEHLKTSKLLTNKGCVQN